MLKRLRGAATPLPLAGLFLILVSVSVIALGGGTRPAEAEAQDDSCKIGNPPTVRAASRTPAAITGYEVTFTIPCDLPSNADSIVMVLHEDIGVPRGINPFAVRIRHSSNGTNGSLIPAVDVSLKDQDDPRRPTTITIILGVNPNNGTNGISPGDEVTVTFNKVAGISNPTEGGAFSWTVATRHSGALTSAVRAQHPEKSVRDAFTAVETGADHTVEELKGLLVDWEIQLSHEKVHRGEEVTVIGRGYKNGTTLTFWRDADFDGVRDTEEEQLCQTNVASNDIGYCTFTVNKPPFEGIFGECKTVAVTKDANGSKDYAEARKAADNANCNFINGVDGLNHSSIWIGELEEERNDNSVTKEYYSLEKLPQVLELEGYLTADVGASRRLSVQMQDFPEGNLTALDIGGVAIVPKTLRSNMIPASGSLHFTVDLPGGVRRGYQSLRVVVTDNDERDYEVQTVLWVEPDAIVTALPDQALPNQRVHLEGRGFLVADGRGAVASINIGGYFLDLAGVNGGEGPAPIDRHGNWRGYVDLPINAATTTPGTKELRIVDGQGRGGTVEVTIPPREVTVAPIWGRPGSIVTVTGKGFPSRNDNGSNVNLQIRYQSSVGYAVASAEADGSGNFSGEIRVPLRTPAPSSNFVTVAFVDDDGTRVITTARHEVPGAAITVNPEAGPPGTPVSLAGQGFRKFTKVNSATIGALDVTPGGTVTTDANGDFSLTFLAPGVGVGSQTVRVTVAGVTASAPFYLSPSGVAAGTPVPVAEALERLGDKLSRVFHFNNDSKVWTFYDPELAEDENTQHVMIAGETYLVLVRETMSAILNGQTRQLTCHQGNCWNQIIW